MAVVGFALIILAILLAIIHVVVTWNENFISESHSPPRLKAYQPANKTQGEAETAMVDRGSGQRESTHSRLGNFWRRLSSGVYLTDLKILLWIIVTYVALFFGTWVALSVHLQTNDESKPFLIAYGVATGSDPLDFKSDLAGHPRLFGWVLFIRLLSWLLIPIIAGATLDAVYRINEERKLKAQRNLQARLKEFGERAGLTGPELEELLNWSAERITNPDNGKAEE